MAARSINDFTILVAEDDEADRFFINRAFTKAGIKHLVFVEDGQEAIDYLGGEADYSDRAAYPLPDLMLLDLKMPRLNGFDVLEWLRKQPGLRRLLVTILTSSDQATDIDRAYDLGANSYLLKPHGSHELTDLVNRLQRYWLELNQRPVTLEE